MAEVNPVESLRAAFSDAVQDVQEFRGELTIVVDKARMVDICRYCRDTKGLEYNFLSDVAGVDYYPQEPRFAVSYLLYSMVHNRELRLKALLSSDDTEIASINDIFPSANWSEREIYDMFGITFTGHPDLRRLLMPDDWDGHPLRKDYPLGYETVQFSFNFDEVDKFKPYARE